MTQPQRISDESLETWFTYHPPREDQIAAYQSIRAAAKEFATLIVDRCPPGADTSAAIRSVRLAVMQANAAIACDTPVTPSTPQRVAFAYVDPTKISSSALASIDHAHDHDGHCIQNRHGERCAEGSSD